QILHYHVVLVRQEPGAGYDVRLERIVAQRFIAASNELLRFEFSFVTFVVRLVEEEQELIDLFDVFRLTKAQKSPEFSVAGGGVEDEMKPALRLGEALVSAEVHGDR